MGENYTRKTENYTARQNNHQNIQTQSKPMSFTCWRCNKGFELPSEKAKPDQVWCPHCEMIHGQITHSKDA
jgi:Zn finger protein HypA/HybF involved in hydrogenase expression